MLTFLRWFTEFPLLTKKFHNPAYHKYAERTGSAPDHNHLPVPSPVSEAKRYCGSCRFLTRIGLRSFLMGVKHHHASQPDFLRQKKHTATFCGCLGWINVSSAQWYLTLLIGKPIFLFTALLFTHWKDRCQQPTFADNLIKVPGDVCLSVGVCIQSTCKRVRMPIKAMLDFYSSPPTRMQEMNNLKGLSTRQLKIFFFLDWKNTMKGLAGFSEDFRKMCQLT